MIIKGVLNHGKPQDPRALSIDFIKLFKDGRKPADIRNIVVNFELFESIYQPAVSCVFGIKDAANFFEEYELSGEERIRVGFTRTISAKGSEETTGKFQVEFKVTEYPVFGRTESESEQVYKIKGISQFAFNSSFQKISRAYEGKPIDLIRNIIREDCLFQGNFAKPTGNDITTHKGVITWKSPLQAVEYFRKLAVNAKGMPFFVYQTSLEPNPGVNEGRIRIDNLLSMTRRPIFRTYYAVKDFKSQAGDGKQTSFEEKSKRIIDVESQMGLSKYKLGREGAFASETNFVDLSNKSFIKNRKIYNYDKDTQGFGGKLGHENTALGIAFRQRIRYLSKNQASFDSNINYGQAQSKGVDKRDANEILLDNMVHDITVFGDPGLRCGRRIEIKIPKAIDPEIGSGYDEHLSGIYLITACTHRVDQGDYFCKLRLKRLDL